MSGKAHSIISALLLQCFAIVFYKDFTPIPLVIGAIFGLIADIDTDQSKISYMLIKHFGGKKINSGKGFNPNGYGSKNSRHKSKLSDAQIEKHNAKVTMYRRVGMTFSLSLLAIGLTILSRKNIFFSIGCMYVSILVWTKHRSLSHTLLSSLIVGGCCFLSFRLYGLAQYGIYCGLGYLLHVLEDSLTKTGTPLLYPISKKNYKIPLMSTGSDSGKLVEFAFMVISFCLCIVTYLTMIR